MKSLTLGDIADLLGAKLVGNEGHYIEGVCAADNFKANHICFLRLKTLNSVTKSLEASSIDSIILKDSLASASLPSGKNYLFAKNPLKAISRLAREFHPLPRLEAGVSSKAEIHPSAKISSSASIGAYTVIGENVEIGEDCQIHPHVVVYQNVKIASNTVIHSGAAIREGTIIGNSVTIQNNSVIGADGFGYFLDEEVGHLVAIPQVGVTVIGDYVEVGASTCIDRGTFDNTIIGKDSKIDNLVQIGHNVKLGNHCIVCGHSAIGGSTALGDWVTVGGHSCLADHVKVAPGSRLAGGTAVAESLKTKGDYAGYPAIPAISWKRQLLALSKLPKLIKDIGK